jgi:hypothetical protein
MVLHRPVEPTGLTGLWLLKLWKGPEGHLVLTDDGTGGSLFQAFRGRAKAYNLNSPRAGSVSRPGYD